MRALVMKVLPMTLAFAAVVATYGAVRALDQTETSVSLTTNKNRIMFGEAVILKGQITSDVAACTQDVEGEVQLEEQDDTRAWRSIGVSKSNDSGAYKVAVVPRNSGTLRVSTQPTETSGCVRATSNRSAVRVRLRVTLVPKQAQVPAGSRVRLVARVAPACERFAEGVTLEVFRDGKFHDLRKKKAASGCRFVFAPRVDDTSVFRARHDGIISVGYAYYTGRSDQQVVGVQE